ncbi:MAG: methyltransferase domain-containing protein [Ignavibacteriae bacterium]|nr:methyltransferase domain-containing protein [Ignavibacteriota bacterium]
MDYLKFTTYDDIEDVKRLKFIVDNIGTGFKSDARVLEIGCGNGNICIALGSLGYDVLGIDMDDVSIGNAASRNKFSNVRFEVKDAEKFNPADKFDAVVCSEVLEHLHEPERMVKVLSGLLKPGGILVATVPNGWGPRELLITRPVQFLMKHGFGKIITGLKKLLGFKNATLQSASGDLEHIQFFSKGGLTKMIKGYGFSQIKFGHANFVESVFPYSIIAKKIKGLQKLDCAIADILPYFMTCGFYSAWKKL